MAKTTRTASENSRAGEIASLNLEEYRQRLLGLERELAERLGEEVETARHTRDDQPDAVDQANVEELRDESFTVAETDSAILAQVRAALARIDDGTFGQCVIDGEAIGEKRLNAVPWTPYCLKHQAELEARSPIRSPSL